MVPTLVPVPEPHASHRLSYVSGFCPQEVLASSCVFSDSPLTRNDYIGVLENFDFEEIFFFFNQCFSVFFFISPRPRKKTF